MIKLILNMYLISLLGFSFNTFASNFGTEKTYSKMYLPPSFVPHVDSASYIRDTRLNVRSGSSTDTFYATVHLPTGTKPVDMVAILSDFSANDITLELNRVCNDFGSFFTPNTNIIITTMIALSSSGNGEGSKYYSASVQDNDTHHINNLNCGYLIELKLGEIGASNVHNFIRVALRYKRDVTAAPSSAPFSDVPISHPFSQHINAFKNAGITGGCGGGNFCPDDPVTRGQMAVFLAKAMGLSWNDSNGITITQPLDQND